VVKFWDYFEESHGIRLAPEDLGIASWNEYQPGTARAAASGDLRAQRNYAVMTALIHYEWLMQAQRFGQWAQAQGPGRYDLTMNPEDTGNGGDYAMMIRLADVGIPYMEFFGGPAILRSAYANMPIYMRAARDAGRAFGACMELGAGGHGQHYCDTEVNYLMLYELGAMGFEHLHTDWAEAPWSVMTNPKNAYHFDRFSNWMGFAYGWRQARRENALRPQARVVSVSQRSSVHYIQAWPWSVEQMDSFGSALSDAHVDYEQTDSQDLPNVLKSAEVLFYTPPASRREDAARIAAWLETGGKTLITHSYIPLSLDDGGVKIRSGVSQTEFRGEEFNYADYIDPLQRLDQGFVLHPAFKGLTGAVAGNWSLPQAGGTEAGRDEIWRTQPMRMGLEAVAPLVSEYRLPNGSRIVYLHRRPQDLMPRQLAAIMRTWCDQYNIARVSYDDARLGSPALAHVYASDIGQTAILWNTRRLEELGDVGGYGPHLAAGSRGESF